jgi:uncharacterized membrane protein (UPF0127 family)
MTRWGSIVNLSRAGEQVAKVRWCQSFLCRLRGLTFRRSLELHEGLLLVERSESRSNTAIHMWMVFFPIAAVWLDQDFRVVDLRLAKPWRVYIPSAPAKYVLEGSAQMLAQLSVGDRLAWVDD